MSVPLWFWAFCPSVCPSIRPTSHYPDFWLTNLQTDELSICARGFLALSCEYMEGMASNVVWLCLLTTSRTDQSSVTCWFFCNFGAILALWNGAIWGFSVYWQCMVGITWNLACLKLLCSDYICLLCGIIWSWSACCYWYVTIFSH